MPSPGDLIEDDRFDGDIRRLKDSFIESLIEIMPEIVKLVKIFS